MTKKLLTLALLFLSLNTFAQERIALVIGNADYQVSALKNALNDAQDITKALTELDFKVTLVENADKRTMKDAIYDFSEKLNKDTVGLFYYAGHAVQYHGENYLIPINALPEIKKIRHLEDEAVRSRRVSKNMEESGSKLNFIFLDSCRNNPLPAESRGIVQGLTRSQEAEGSLIAFSTSPGRTADDGEGRNSPYTKSLLKFINTPNQPVELMLKEVKEAVSDETNGNQLPWYESSITGNFCFKTTAEGCAEFVKVIYDPFLEGIYDIETLEFENGDKYTGQSKDGLMYGVGILTYASGAKYYGDFDNGQRHGNGKIIQLNGNSFEGIFVDNKRNGKGILKWINGASMETRWTMDERVYSDNFFVGITDDNGLPDGYGTYFFNSGEKREGNWINGKLNGQVVITSRSGELYKGQYSNNNFNGNGVLLTSSNERFEGNFVNGLLNGKGLRIWPNGDRYDGEFVNGNMQGKGIKSFASGKKYDGQFNYNLFNGQGILTFDNGDRYEGSFQNDKYHGTVKLEEATGYSYKGDWSHGIP